MDQYRTSGVLDENTYHEISRFLLPRRHVLFIRIYAIVVGIFTVLMFISKNYPYTVLFLLITVLFAMGPMLLRKLYLHRTLKRMREIRAEPVRTETFFTLEGVTLRNPDSGKQAVLPYETIRSVAQTEHYFFLATKANQFTLVFKDCLAAEQLESFVPFLKEHCPRLKIMR